MIDDERGTVVVDTGSGMWMAGFAGSDEPVIRFASETRRQPSGEEAESEIFRPIKVCMTRWRSLPPTPLCLSIQVISVWRYLHTPQRGRIEDLKEFDRLVHKSLVQELGIKPEECRVLLTEVGCALNGCVNFISQPHTHTTAHTIAHTITRTL